jgi:hypothetical protein
VHAATVRRTAATAHSVGRQRIALSARQKRTPKTKGKYCALSCVLAVVEMPAGGLIVGPHT